MGSYKIQVTNYNNYELLLISNHNFLEVYILAHSK